MHTGCKMLYSEMLHELWQRTISFIFPLTALLCLPRQFSLLQGFFPPFSTKRWRLTILFRTATSQLYDVTLHKGLSYQVIAIYDILKCVVVSHSHFTQLLPVCTGEWLLFHSQYKRASVSQVMHYFWLASFLDLICTTLHLLPVLASFAALLVIVRMSRQVPAFDNQTKEQPCTSCTLPCWVFRISPQS